MRLTFRKSSTKLIRGGGTSGVTVIFGRNGWSMTGGYQIASGAIQFVDEPYITDNAQKDILIAQSLGFFDSSNNTFTARYAAMKAINSDIKILPYLPPSEPKQGTGGSSGPAWIRDILDDDGHSSWYLRNTAGEQTESQFSAANLRSSWAVQFNTDNSAGRNFAEELAVQFNTAITKVNANGAMLPVIDGLFLDVVPPSFQKVFDVDSDPRTVSNQDFDQDGNAESTNDETDGGGVEADYGGVRMYRRGAATFPTEIVSAVGPNFVVFRNGGKDGLSYSAGNELGDADPLDQSEFYQHWGGNIFENAQKSLCCERNSGTNEYDYQGFNGLNQQSRHLARQKSSVIPEATHPWGKFGEHAVVVEMALLDRTPLAADFEMARYYWAFARLNGAVNAVSRGKSKPFPLMDEDVVYMGDTTDGLPPTMGTFDASVANAGTNADYTLRSPDFESGAGDFYWQLFEDAGTRYCVVARTDPTGVTVHGDGTAIAVQLPDYGSGNTVWKHLDGTDTGYVNPFTGMKYSNQTSSVNNGSAVDSGGSFGQIDLLPFHARLLVAA